MFLNDKKQQQEEVLQVKKTTTNMGATKKVNGVTRSTLTTISSATSARNHGIFLQTYQLIVTTVNFRSSQSQLKSISQTGRLNLPAGTRVYVV